MRCELEIQLFIFNCRENDKPIMIIVQPLQVACSGKSIQVFTTLVLQDLWGNLGKWRRFVFKSKAKLNFEYKQWYIRAVNTFSCIPLLTQIYNTCGVRIMYEFNSYHVIMSCDINSVQHMVI